MKDKLTKAFKNSAYEPNQDLERLVWGSIIKRDKRNAQFKLWAFGLVGFASLTGLIPALKILFTDMARSGFYEYFSLIFSDTRSVIFYWKELSFSLAESLPIISIVSALSLLFICFLSLKYLMKQVNRGQLISSLTFN